MPIIWNWNQASQSFIWSYYMEETKLNSGGNKKVYPTDRTFNVFVKIYMTNWVCFYEISNYNEAKNL